ncbi:MAG TPA: DUF2784 domain-containing protein [Pseudomonas xinjiangensis]|uniref:DUF2784 domain-containing protein n=2 Tax=root TaxID=1 RepID=A0A7V1BMC9_9GAMM|nr:DUF2784 domain-containing protein [Halopseudomonas xinjiangensis]HEC46409.1 DUF2784 domain-containing protein [Halopseudomonas xinjiangensis]
MTSGAIYSLLADVVLTTHLALVVFVVLGLVVVWVGNFCHWRWVNNLWFRLAHLATILIVVAEAWLGVVCPLTTLEMWLRAQAGATAYAGGFIEYWMQRILYYTAPDWVFIVIYTVFAGVVAATFWWFPPRYRSR